MERYKPCYLGKILPMENQSITSSFLNNKYDLFSEIYDVCKDFSESIQNIEMVNCKDSLDVKLTTGIDTLNSIRNKLTSNLDLVNDLLIAKDIK